MDIFQKTTVLDKLIISNILKEGDTAVDATCGNGHDTLFLAKKIGKTGRVFSFDIQAKAINETTQLLIENGLNNRVIILQQDHSKMDEYVPCGVRAVMFNLGYLPGSDKNVVTLPATTLAAIENGLHLLKKRGILTCVLYPGHETGKKESLQVENFCNSLDYTMFEVIKIASLNRKSQPPYIIAIKKI